MKRNLIVIYLLLAAGMLIAGCCDQVPVFPAGSYVARNLEGEFILDFEKSGVYTAVLAGNKVITEGAYRPTADTITFTAAPPCTGEATYLWIRDGDTLTFEVSGKDLCPDRRTYLQDMIYTCVTCT